MKIPKNEMYFTDDAEIQLSKSEDGKETFGMLAYSGKVIKGRSFWGDLSIDVSGIKFKGKRFPILEQHELGRKIGVSNAPPKIKDNQVVFDKINLLKNEVAQEFKSNLDEGFPYQASIGIKPLVIEELMDDQTAEVNGYKMKGPGSIIRKSEFKEASVCVFGADPNTSLFSDTEESMSIELISNKPEQNKETELEEKSMTFEELKEKYPDLHKEIGDKFAEKDSKLEELSTKLANVAKEKEDFEKETEKLSESLKETETRMNKLEKAEALRKAQDLKNQADKIVDEKLSEYNIPARLHTKVKKQFNHEQFIDENEAFDNVKFSEIVDAEVKDWSETLSEFKQSDEKVMGFSGSDSHEKFSDNTDDDADRLLGYVTKSDNK